MRHQAADEVNVAAQPVQLGYRHRATLAAGLCQRSGELRAPLERIAALACFDLNEHTRKLKAFSLGETGERLALRFDAET
jgi:hypothetical protein